MWFFCLFSFCFCFVISVDGVVFEQQDFYSKYSKAEWDRATDEQKKSILEELPIRDLIKNRSSDWILSSNVPDDSPVKKETEVVEFCRSTFAHTLNASINTFGQDLKHEQQITEMLADIFIDLYTAESTVVRAQKIMDIGNQDRTVSSIAKIFTAEMVLRLLNLSLTALNGIYRGQTTPIVFDKMRNFQAKMLMPTDIVNLKREVAQRIFNQKEYPF